METDLESYSPRPNSACAGCVYLSSSASCRGYLQIFCTGVSRKPSREMSIIFCSSRACQYNALAELGAGVRAPRGIGVLL